MIDIARAKPGQYMVRSASNPARAHLVLRRKDFSWACDCKAATYRGRCRHISTARAFETAIECGFDQPTAEDVEYYRIVEDGKEARAKRGIPIAPP